MERSKSAGSGRVSVKRIHWPAIGLALFAVLAARAEAVVVDSNAPLRTNPSLSSVTIFERTGGTAPTAYTFGVNSSQMTTRRSDPLSAANSDISTSGPEYYDVYYSNSDGSFNIDGAFISVEAVFGGTGATNAGLNLAEVRLNFSDGSTQYAQGVSSFLRLGGNSFPDRVTQAVDGNLSTHTAMGNTSGSSQRLRVTVSFHLPTAVAQISNLSSITIFERTAGSAPTGYVFGVGSSELNGKRSDPLGVFNNDIATAAFEYYDVYYSNGDGSFNANGAFVTIEALYDNTAIGNGGLNVAEVQLNFGSGSTRLAKGVSSFLRLGGNNDVDRVCTPVDGNQLTHTAMGNTNGQSQRLRVTVGF